MDTSIFLGGKEPTTLKELAAVLGKETIDTYNTGESRGRETSHSLKRCVSVREPYSAERRKAASERAKAAGYQPPVKKSGS